MKLEGVIRKITRLIIEACNPEAIVLFGSYAKGQENSGSDLDIVVIGNFEESPYLRDQELRGLLCQYAIRIDLHMITPAEVASATTDPYSFLSSAMASGVVLHSNIVSTEKWMRCRRMALDRQNK